jgi:ribosome biogenesis GTPase
MPLGLITKALSGYYYVLPDDRPDDAPLQCRARGVFKNRGLSPLVGDEVVFSETENGEGTVVELLPRRTELIRPPIANVDTALLVFAVTEPEITMSLLDKFLVHTERAGLSSIICLSKADLLEKADSQLTARIAHIQDLYTKIGYTVLLCSAKSGFGMNEVKDALAGKKTVFSGQSGVGKSSLINRLIPGLKIETNAISNRLGRGKHTTRHVEFIRHPASGWIADTPGFSQLDFAGIEADELGQCFIEMNQLAEPCKFRGCLHRSEPGCEVLAALEEDEIDKNRYKHYLQFLEEIRERRPRY